MKTPVSIFTGFLGSGKTTLLSRVLEDPSMRNTAVLVNEFGEVGLDHHLLRRVNERTVLLENGCVCCATRGELAESLVEVLSERVERVVIETSGLADPAPILFTLFSDPVLQHRFEVESVVTTVDAVNGDLHLSSNPEATKQIAASDRVVMTKTDISERCEIRALASRIVAVNPSAEIIEASFGNVEPSDLLRRDSVRSAPGDAFPWESHGGSEVRSLSLTFDGAVEWAAFGAWLSMLLHARGEEVLRVKGLLDVGESGPVVLDGVQHVIHPPRHLDAWPDGELGTRLVFIAKGVAPEDILASLTAFSGLLGAEPQPLSSGSADISSRLTPRPA